VKHLISTRNLDRETALGLLDDAQEFSQLNSRAIKKLPTLRGRTVINLFYENSTRTRVSFEIAATRLSADVINVSADGSSVSKGESLRDTAQTLEALGADCIVIRHPEPGAPAQLANLGWIGASVISAGDGTHEHPTQALLDALTMQQTFGADLSGLSVLIVGDILHSRVARSNLLLLRTMGAHVTLAGPTALLPVQFAELGANLSHDFDESLRERPQVVMMLRVQKERMLSNFDDDVSKYVADWSLSNARFASLSSDCIIMHPGPINRGLEICSGAADHPRSAILQQVANGVAVRMAVLRFVLAAQV
jgi:aspartate carbamoyltransferase catalytic subunit